MAKYLNLQIPQSCHEDWNTMLPDQKGKFCLSCQKQVVDFTSVSDQQLINYFKNHKRDTCGRFNANQLDRDIVIPEKKIPWLRYLFQITIPAFLLSLKATGQSKNKLSQVETVSVTKEEIAPAVISVDTSNYPTKTVQGVVKDETGSVVPEASIYIKGTKRGTVADSTGRFTLTYVQEGATLVVSCVGFQAMEWPVPKEPGEMTVLVTGIEIKRSVLGGAVAVVVRSKSARGIKKNVTKEVCVKPISPEVSLYPNPITPNSAIHLKWLGLTAGNYSVEVFNMSGALLHTLKLEVESWMTDYVLEPKLMEGNYVVTVTNQKSGVRLSKQIVVN